MQKTTTFLMFVGDQCGRAEETRKRRQAKIIALLNAEQKLHI